MKKFFAAIAAVALSASVASATSYTSGVASTYYSTTQKATSATMVMWNVPTVVNGIVNNYIGLVASDINFWAGLEYDSSSAFGSCPAGAPVRLFYDDGWEAGTKACVALGASVYVLVKHNLSGDVAIQWIVNGTTTYNKTLSGRSHSYSGTSMSAKALLRVVSPAGALYPVPVLTSVSNRATLVVDNTDTLIMGTPYGPAWNATVVNYGFQRFSQ